MLRHLPAEQQDTAICLLLINRVLEQGYSLLQDMSLAGRVTSYASAADLDLADRPKDGPNDRVYVGRRQTLVDYVGNQSPNRMAGRHRIERKALVVHCDAVFVPGEIWVCLADDANRTPYMHFVWPRYVMPEPIELPLPTKYRIGLGCRSGGHGPKRKGPGLDKKKKQALHDDRPHGAYREIEQAEVCPRCQRSRNAIVWCVHEPGNEFALADVVRIAPPARDTSVRELCQPEIVKVKVQDDDGYDRACELVDARLVEIEAILKNKGK